MTIKKVRLSNGFSCFIGEQSIMFNMRDGRLTVPTITFCKMDFQSAKNWLSIAGIEIDRDDFRSIYFDGGLSLANLLNHGLNGDDNNGN